MVPLFWKSPHCIWVCNQASGRTEELKENTHYFYLSSKVLTRQCARSEHASHVEISRLQDLHENACLFFTPFIFISVSQTFLYLFIFLFLAAPLGTSFERPIFEEFSKHIQKLWGKKMSEGLKLVFYTVANARVIFLTGRLKSEKEVDVKHIRRNTVCPRLLPHAFVCFCTHVLKPQGGFHLFFFFDHNFRSCGF